MRPWRVRRLSPIDRKGHRAVADDIGDFVTSDDEMANAIARVAINMGCTVVFDEQPVLTP